MKGVNLKKIGAIVAGATILASSVAFAGLFYQNTELVDANGQPVAKVVLGSGAAASDGAVAGAIAAKLASAAYKKQTLTASVASDATCTPTASGNATGTCAISNKKVTLEVTVPGMSSSGVHDFVTAIGDYIDRLPENRYTGLGIVPLNTDNNFDFAESETDPAANPFSDGMGSFIDVSSTDFYKVSGDDFTPFATKTITDPSSGDTYSEMQNAYIQGSTQYTDADKAIEANLQHVVYQAKFDDSGHNGILVCTSDEFGHKYYAECPTSAPEYTGKHRVKISFLGSDWIITDLTPPTPGGVTDSDQVVAGGEVKLAKESVYGIVNVGESLSSSDSQLKVRLDDISTAVGSENTHPAVVSFIDANGNVLSQDQIMPGATLKKTIGGKTYRVRVYQTAPGYTFGAKWAEMAMLENELDLKDDNSIDDTTNQDWNVRIFWKNKDASSTPPGDEPDALRSIVLYKSSFTDQLVAGQTVNVVEDPVAYKFTYQGLNLQSGDYDTLKYATGGNVNLKLYQQDGSGNDYTCAVPSNGYIRVTTGVTDGFQLNVPLSAWQTVTGTGKDKEFYYVLATSPCTAPAGPTHNVLPGEIVMKKSGSSPTKYLVFDTSSGGANPSPDVQYKTAGSRGVLGQGGVVKFDNTGSMPGVGGSDAFPSIFLLEDIGTAYDIIGPSEITHAEAGMGVWYDSVGKKFYDAQAGTDDARVYTVYPYQYAPYAPYTFLGLVSPPTDTTVGYDVGTFERGYISPRGSKFDSMSSSAVQFKVAKKLGVAQYEFATTEAAGGNSTTQLTLQEGQTGNVGDITIKAKSIDVTVGACSASGGAATCTVPKDQLSAVIMPNNAATADVMVPFAVNPKLVVLDTDAASVSTGVLITVGGDQVNSVTAGAMAGAGIDFTATPQVVKVVGNKIVVAGLSASDTVAAGDQFLAALRAQ